MLSVNIPNMTDDAEAFAKTIKERIDALDTSVFALETAAGLPPDAIRNVLRSGGGKAGPTLARAAEICRALGLELYFGPKRESAPVEALSEADQGHYVPVPLHEVLLAAGAGADNGEAIIDRLAFRRDWLKRINVTASAARLARVAGESMMPTLFPGDLVMIDTASTIPPITKRSPQDRRRSPIYALAEGTGARIKRIERPSEDQLLLLSDNPDYAPELRTGCDLAELKIIGKVVWWGHTVKE